MTPSNFEINKIAHPCIINRRRMTLLLLVKKNHVSVNNEKKYSRSHLPCTSGDFSRVVCPVSAEKESEGRTRIDGVACVVVWVGLGWWVLVMLEGSRQVEEV